MGDKERRHDGHGKVVNVMMMMMMMVCIGV